jgi:hypothetical protein
VTVSYIRGYPYVYDLLDGVQTIADVAPRGLPDLKPLRTTDTALAFQQVERILDRELERNPSGPAPRHLPSLSGSQGGHG